MIFTPEKLRFFIYYPYSESIDKELFNVILIQRAFDPLTDQFLHEEDRCHYPTTFYEVAFWVFRTIGNQDERIRIPGHGAWFPNMVTKDDILSGKDIEFHWLPEKVLIRNRSRPSPQKLYHDLEKKRESNKPIIEDLNRKWWAKYRPKTPYPASAPTSFIGDAANLLKKSTPEPKDTP
jgi:hypothetical protein